MPRHNPTDPVLIRLFFEADEVHELKASNEEEACRKISDISKLGLFIRGDFDGGFVRFYPPNRLVYALILKDEFPDEYDDDDDDDEDSFDFRFRN